MRWKAATILSLSVKKKNLLKLIWQSICIRTVSSFCLLSALMSWLKLVDGLFRLSHLHWCTLNSCPNQPRRNQMYQRWIMTVAYVDFLMVFFHYDFDGIRFWSLTQNRGTICLVLFFVKDQGKIPSNYNKMVQSKHWRKLC